jgi:c-di-GMP-binding flagellar brake protein YcgR
MLEQRRYERVAFYCNLDLTVLPDGPTVPGRSFDLSVGGAGIITQLSLKRGQAIRIRFHLPNGPNEVIDEDLLGQVAYTRADEDGNRTGIQFLETIREATQPTLARKLNAL